MRVIDGWSNHYNEERYQVVVDDEGTLSLLNATVPGNEPYREAINGQAGYAILRRLATLAEERNRRDAEEGYQRLNSAFAAVADPGEGVNISLGQSLRHWRESRAGELASLFINFAQSMVTAHPYNNQPEIRSEFLGLSDLARAITEVAGHVVEARQPGDTEKGYRSQPAVAPQSDPEQGSLLIALEHSQRPLPGSFSALLLDADRPPLQATSGEPQKWGQKPFPASAFAAVAMAPPPSLFDHPEPASVLDRLETAEGNIENLAGVAHETTKDLSITEGNFGEHRDWSYRRIKSLEKLVADTDEELRARGAALELWCTGNSARLAVLEKWTAETSGKLDGKFADADLYYENLYNGTNGRLRELRADADRAIKILSRRIAELER